jgi:competence protein ComEC
LLRLNDQARRTALQLMTEPHASLLVGILLGVQSTLPEEVRDAFSIAGLTHILVISGWNITIIVVCVSGAVVACGVGRKRAVACSLPVIALYVCFVGVSPSVVRAAIMGSLAVLAVLVDRESDAWTSLLVACVVMAIADPHVLWDIGFQLSALATAGLFAFARPIEGRLRAWRVLQWGGARWAIEPLTATLAASTLTLPIIVYHFGRLSLITPLANVLILPVVPYAMLFGAIATAAGMIWMPAGELLALLAWPFLEWMVLASRWLARVPGAAATLPPFAAWWVWGYYGIVAIAYAWRMWQRESRKISPAFQGEPA